MALTDEQFADLSRFKTGGETPGAPTFAHRFYAPVDEVHKALITVVKAAKKSLHVAMYGFDDDELADVIHAKIEHPHLFVTLSLDKSQAGGVHERAILAKQDYPATSIAVGHSEKGAIMHLKTVVVDGIDTISGSTNWSTGGEEKQDNELTVTRNPWLAHDAETRLAVIHDSMLQQMAKSS